MIKNPNVLKFIHLTDCHITGNGTAMRDRRPADRLRAAIDSINMDHDNADFVVITGDLTKHGDDDGYKILAKELRRLSVPSHLMVGNHDDARAFGFQFPETQRCEHGFIQGSKRTPFGLCLFLDTSKRGSHGGEFCSRRRDWLRNALKETKGPVMLFMHHPPFSIGTPDADDNQSKLYEADAFWGIIEPHRDRIRHIFVGHAHRAMFGNWRGISVSGMRRLIHQADFELDRDVNGQQDPVEPPAYGVVLADADQILIHLHNFSGSAPSKLSN